MSDSPDTAARQAEDLARAESTLGKPLNPPGASIVFHCSCGQTACHDALHVIPIKIHGHKRIDLMTIGAGGVILSDDDRQHLCGILANHEWFGA